MWPNLNHIANSACGDILSQVGTAEASFLKLYSINGKKVGETLCQPAVTSLCFSTTPEGVAANAIATGHAKNVGVVRLWSTWDLAPLRDISTQHCSTVVALTFSVDNQVGQSSICLQLVTRPQS